MLYRIKKRWIITFSILLLVIFFVEKRSFYCLENGKCITVWKTLNNVCYVIPYEYYGILKPSDNYIQTTNLSYISIYWSNDFPDDIFFAVSPSYDLTRIVNNSSNKLTFNNIYYSQKEYGEIVLQNNTGKRPSIIKEYYRNILYQEETKKRFDVRKNISFLEIDIAGNRLVASKSSKSD